MNQRELKERIMSDPDLTVAEKNRMLRDIRAPYYQMSDEELLQLIDLEHKNQYIFERIGREIECGKRAGWPQTYHLQ